ncbi:MAG: ATP synthase F1 subunit delta [Candidatus Margulisiibacteriota bacterium]|jgi:F-type H+-transporting ATPase subunit delta
MRKLEIDFEKVFQLAQERNEVEILDNNLFNLYQLNRSNFQIRILFSSKILSFEDKMKIIQKLFGSHASKLFYELVYILLKNNQMYKLYHVTDKYSSIVREKLNLIIIQVFSAVPLTQDATEKLKQVLVAVTNKKVTLKNFIDPTLIGGWVIKFPDGKIYNLSYKEKLHDLKYYLLER